MSTESLLLFESSMPILKSKDEQRLKAWYVDGPTA
jgi:hypothetical protein